AKAQCEIDGTCGTHVPGVAAAAEERRAARGIALSNFDDAEAAPTRGINSATAAAQAKAATGQAQGDPVPAEPKSRRAGRAAEQDAFEQSVRNDTGLLSRIEALDSVGDRRGDLWVAQLLLFLLFTSLEVLPVLVKLMQVVGPPTLYDELLTDM